MPDPFLLAHRVGPLLFDIGGRISPISIRDQMVRGRMIVDRAVENGLINNDYPLLVVGAGAAGATAAIHSVAQHGVRAMLVEKAPTPFLRQANCYSRWVDPTHYDWPMIHWREGRYHWTAPAMPLAWQSDWASSIASLWTARLGLAQMLLRGNLWIRYNTRVVASGVLASRRGIQVWFSRSPRLMTFGMIILSSGFGTEKCSVIDKYSGFQFWDTDDFEQPNFGFTQSPLPTPRVLISGGGDGGLQDFLRIVTYEPTGGTYEKSARDIYERLRYAIKNVAPLPAPAVLSAWESVWHQVEHEVQSAEDQANRAYIWGDSPRHDHYIHEPLHRAHQRAVNKLWKFWNKTGTWQAIDDQMQKLLRSNLPSVKLIHSCTHFGQCYGLNRFLVIFFAKYLQERKPKSDVVLEPNRKLLKVMGVSPHRCRKNPTACHGEEHEVTFLDANCLQGSVSGTATVEPYNVIIIRHGIDPPKKTQIAFPRQILPYHASS